MSAVTFPNGNTYNDDNQTPTNLRGLANGGHDTLLVPMISDTVEISAVAVEAAEDAQAAAAAAAVAASSVETDATIATAAAAAAAASALAAAESADEAAAIAGGGIKVTVADTTYKVLNDAITVTAPLTKSVTSPGGNEHLNIALDLTGRPSMAQILWQQIFS